MAEMQHKSASADDLEWAVYYDLMLHNKSPNYPKYSSLKHSDLVQLEWIGILGVA